MATAPRKLELTAFGFALALVLFVAYLGHRSAEAQVETAERVDHTHQVISELDEILIASIDAETGRRGYALRGNESLLVPYRNAATRAAAHMHALRDLIADNPEELARLTAVEPHVTNRLRLLEEAVAAQRARGGNRAEETPDSVLGWEEMSAVRAGIAEMASTERRLLAERQERTRESVKLSRHAQLAGAALSIFLLTLVVMRLRRAIGEREKSEERVRENARALRRAHAFLDSILENIPDMVFVKDAHDLAFVRFNRAGEKLLGLTREELIGKTDFAFFAPDQAQAFVDKDRETLRGKELVDIPEEPLTTATGVRWLHTKKVPLLGENGEPEYLLGISADITERRRDEVTLRASKDATEAAHRELEAFSYSVAHDLRAPLRSIDGFSQALLEDYGDKLDDDGKDHLARVRKAAQRMAELIDDLLALARVSRAELARVSVDVSALACEVGEGAKSAHPKAELVVAGDLTVNADPRLLRVLLENLLGNAFKFSAKREDARIEVGQRIENGVPVLFVKDNGAGFDLAAAKKLFTAFQRYHPTNEYEGTGIGLATAERIVSRHGGRIWAESTPGGGAVFRFILDTSARTTP